MPRPIHRADEDGILTIPLVSRLLGISAPKVRSITDEGGFAGSYRIPGTAERRIPAPSVIEWCRLNKFPIPKELLSYLEAYNMKFASQAEASKTEL